MTEAGAPITRATHEALSKALRSVRDPPGVVMLSPPRVPRNPSRAQGEGPRQGG
jgi:hypothetical protein